MNRTDLFKLLKKQEAGLTTQEENREISTFFDQLQNRSVAWKMNPIEERAIRNRIKRNIDQRLGNTSKNRPMRVYVYRIAACLLIIGGLGLYHFHRNTQPIDEAKVYKTTNDRQKAIITLPDGTKVHLNVNSSLEFFEPFAPDTRDVYLHGEAFFEVVSDPVRPFRVFSNGVETNVLGTSFNVKSVKGKDVEVVVNTGKVSVSLRDTVAGTVFLQPSQKATISQSSSTIKVEEVDPMHSMLWRAEKISFDLLPLDQLLHQLSQVYNIKIDLEGYRSKGCLIKATYTNSNIYAVFKGLKNLVDFDMEKVGEGHFLIRYNGCKI